MRAMLLGYDEEMVPRPNRVVPQIRSNLCGIGLRISSGAVVHSFMICRGAMAAMTVTAEASRGTPRCSASVSQLV